MFVFFQQSIYRQRSAVIVFHEKMKLKPIREMKKVCFKFAWLLISLGIVCWRLCWESILFRYFIFKVKNAQAQPNADFYTAAVVEFSLSSTPNIAVANPRRMIESSLNEYLRLINEATESRVDVVVFPEGSLNYNGIGTRKELIKFAVELNESVDLYNSTSFNNTCDYSKQSSVRKSCGRSNRKQRIINFPLHKQIIAKISFNARKNKIYVLINVIERSNCDGSETHESCALYSSNLVFDRNGCIVSRYRKFSTKYDPMLNSTSIPEVQIFYTGSASSFKRKLLVNVMFVRSFLRIFIVKQQVAHGHLNSSQICRLLGYFSKTSGVV